MNAGPENNSPLFALSEEHQAIREAVRDLCEAKVAPFAAAVDEEARYPEERDFQRTPHLGRGARDPS